VVSIRNATALFVSLDNSTGVFLFDGFDFWILPNLFDESLGYFDSFKPVISLEKSTPGQLPCRLGIGVAFFSFFHCRVYFQI
jgi:hypothetical protein